MSNQSKRGSIWSGRGGTPAMLGRVNSQASFFDLGWHVRIPRPSFWWDIHEFGRLHLRDDDFAEMYSKRGRPSYSPVQMTLALMIQLEKGYSDRELEEESRFDDRVKFALLAGRDFAGIDAVSLCDFRERLLKHEAGPKLLERTLQVAKEKGLFSASNLHLVDSFMVHGAAAVQDTYTMIRLAILRTLKLAQMHGIADALRQGLLRDDYDAPGKPKIDWDDEEARRRLLEELVKDALHIVKTARQLGQLPKDLEPAVTLLERVATQDVKIDENGRVEMVQGTAKDRIISVNDPDMRHGRKTTSSKTDGYKAHVLTTGTNGDLIATIEVTGANAPDREPVPNMLDEEEKKGCRPAEVLGDSAYFDPKEAEKQAAKGTVFTAKAPPATNPSGLFSKEEFVIDTTQGTVTCPAGHTVTYDVGRTAERKATIVQFPKTTCEGCPLRDQCTTGSSGRTVTIHAYEPELQQARQAQRTEEFQEKYRKRSIIERVISHLCRHGARQARYIGLKKTKFQQLLAATLYNIKRVMRAPAQGEVCPA